MDDPFESAMNATLAPRAFYGQVTVDTWYCVLQKGVGKVLFDDTQHALDQRRTAIDITITALPELQRDRPVRREMIAESNEWVRIVLPSIKALGITSLSQLRDKWAKALSVPSGRKYTDKNTGEEREATTLKFLAVYNTEDECRAAMEAERAGDTGNGTTPAPAPAATPAAAPSKDRDTALSFVKVLVNQYHRDPQALAAQIAGIPMIAKHFTIDSPEVQALIAEAAKAA